MKNELIKEIAVYNAQLMKLARKTKDLDIDANMVFSELNEAFENGELPRPPSCRVLVALLDALNAAKKEV